MAKITEKQKANLRPFNTLPVNEQRKIAKKGSKKSAEVRAQRKSFKEALLDALSQLADEKYIHNRAMKQCYNPKLTIGQNLAIAQILNAINGDTKAYEVIRDTIGEKPIEKIEVNEIDSEKEKEIEAFFENE